jgi:hypothetical protein
LVSVTDVKPLILWTQCFPHAQGCDIKGNKVSQESQSAILLEENGRRSSSHQTCSVDFCYSFMTDQVQSKELTVEYYIVADMLMDTFMKPLQGSLFHHSKVLVCPTMLHAPGHRSVLRNDQTGNRRVHTCLWKCVKPVHALKVCPYSSRPIGQRAGLPIEDQRLLATWTNVDCRSNV